MGKKIKLIPAGLTFSHSQRGAYALILTEEDGPRRLPIIIGGFEAQSIAIELEKMTPPRPLTHDLFLKFSEAFDIRLVEVIVHELKEGIFYAKLICENDTKNVELDSRTSDAIALSLRFGCPIYTYEHILDEAGIVLENRDLNLDHDKTEDLAEPIETFSEKVTSADPSELARFSTKELHGMIEEAIDNEDYEKASQIRDEIKRRQEL